MAKGAAMLLFCFIAKGKPLTNYSREVMIESEMKN